MFNYVGNCLSKYFTFKGRARRKEYWSFCFFVFLITAIIFAIAYFTGNYELVDVNDYSTMTVEGPFAVIASVFNILTFFPMLSVSVRRLHDSGKSAWWVIWSFLLSLCCCGALLWLIFMLLPGNEGANKYGKNPRGTE